MKMKPKLDYSPHDMYLKAKAKKEGDEGIETYIDDEVSVIKDNVID